MTQTGASLSSSTGHDDGEGGCSSFDEVERIYVGGFDPPNLSVSEFLQRLQDTPSLSSAVEILLPDTTTHFDEEDARYIHLNVRRRRGKDDDKNDDDTESALDKIAKLYHNVTWKGCKLKVQAAKPHFLDRLQEEIKERQEAASLSTPSKKEGEEDDAINTSATTSATTTRRRYLKIKERYGEQSFSVDTKPYAVESWRGMQSLLRKIERRKKHFQQEHLKDLAAIAHPNNNIKQMEAFVAATNNNAIYPQQGMDSIMRSQSKLNRAVHLRFLDDTSGEEEEKGNSTEEKGTRDIRDDGDGSSEVSSFVSSSDASSSSDSDASDVPNVPEQKSSYVWSSSSSEESDSENDDDDDSDNDKESDNNGVKQQTSQDIIPIPSDDEMDSSASEDGKDDTGNKCTEKISEYTEQASDEVSSEEADEFVPAVEKGGALEESDPSSSDADSDSSPGPMEQENIELLQDVESNLGILASLFPDMKAAKPRKVASDEKGAEEEENASSNKKSGWTSGGIMLRYDPTKNISTTKSKELKGQDDDDERASRGTDTSSETENDSDNSKPEKSPGKKGGNESDEIDSDNDDKSATEKPEPGNIYKQDKLEDVFREAREAATTSDPVVTDGSSGVDAPTTGNFAFGFNLGPEPDKESSKPDNSAGFSFSFFPGTPKEDKGEEQKLGNKEATDNAMEIDGKPSDAPVEGSTQADVLSFRRRGMFFPKEVLDKYQEDFYVMNDGLKILQDKTRYRNDDEIKERWKEERSALTRDFKRKRKYATQPRNKTAMFKKQHR